MEEAEFREQIQRLVVRTLATNPAGEGLCLIGGFRYRLIDRSVRASLDIDYHWDGDLEAKQAEVVRLLQRRLLPELAARFACEGSAGPASGPQAPDGDTRTVDLAVYRPGVANSRIEIPIDLTRIPCLDRPAARTVDGAVQLTVSDADMIESKVLALLCRLYPAARDFVDVFLFQEKLVPDAAARLRGKLPRMKLALTEAPARLATLTRDRVMHVKGIGQTLREQVEPTAVAQIERAGGPGIVFDVVVARLQALLGPEDAR
jgi:hypothetical protein